MSFASAALGISLDSKSSVSPLTAVSTWVRERPTKRAKRAAWDRYRIAIEVLDDARRAFESAPSRVTAEQVRRAEIGYADAIAIAGEFEVMNLSWEISWSWESS